MSLNVLLLASWGLLQSGVFTSAVPPCNVSRLPFTCASSALGHSGVVAGRLSDKAQC